MTIKILGRRCGRMIAMALPFIITIGCVTIPQDMGWKGFADGVLPIDADGNKPVLPKKFAVYRESTIIDTVLRKAFYGYIFNSYCFEPRNYYLIDISVKGDEYELSITQFVLDDNSNKDIYSFISDSGRIFFIKINIIRKTRHRVKFRYNYEYNYAIEGGDYRFVMEGIVNKVCKIKECSCDE